MREKVIKYTSNLIFYIIVFLAFATPLFFIPITTEFLEFNKQFLVIVSTFIILLLWSVNTYAKGQIEIKRSLFDIPMGALLLSFILSLSFSQSRIVSGLSPQTWTLIFLPVLYFAAVNNLETEKQVKAILAAFLVSGGFLGYFIILKYFGPNLFLAQWSQNRAFNPFGGIPSLSVYLLFVSVTSSIIALKQKGLIKTSFFLTAALAFVALILVNPLTSQPLARVLNKTYPRPVVLDAKTSWDVAIETLKNYPLTGAGFGLYDEMFTQFKRVAFNQSPYWNIRFGQAFNQWVELLTLTGLFGLVAFSYLIGYLLKVITSNSGVPASNTFITVSAGLIILIAGTLLTTLNTPLWLLLALLASSLSILHLNRTRPLSGQEFGNEQVIKKVINTKFKATIIFPVAAIAFSIFSFYTLGRFYRAEIYFQKAQEAVKENKATEAYEMMRTAITLNPRKDLYRTQYAQLNFNIASALTNKTDNLTEKDRTDIQRLIQQALRDSILATEVLNPLNSTNWEIRGRIYSNIRGIVADADQWAVASHTQAMNLDPTNPNVRLALGGVYYAQGNFERATNLFAQAVQLKPDLPNAHYNLAWALRQLNKSQEALDEYNIMLSLLPANTDDYNKVKTEMDQLLGSTQKEDSPPEEKIGTVAGERTESSPLEESTPSIQKP